MCFLFLFIQKLAVGGLPEKILTAYQSVLEENPYEDTALNKCNAAVQHLIKAGENVGSSLAQGISSAMGFNVCCLRFISNKKKSVPSLTLSLYVLVCVRPC